MEGETALAGSPCGVRQLTGRLGSRSFALLALAVAAVGFGLLIAGGTGKDRRLDGERRRSAPSPFCRSQTFPEALTNDASSKG